tara:strand:- start:21 stop:182 length:162 start_codon:yes stop_codon:yes gene_type:complete
MVTVYYETDSYAEKVAIFSAEESYAACYSSLEEECFKKGFLRVTESVDEEEMP